MITEEENEPQPLRIIGIPKRRNGKYVLDEFAILNRECGWICPRCNEEVRICPTQAGEQTFVCKKCNASFTVHVDAEATTFMLDKKKPAAPPVETPRSAANAFAAGAPIMAQQQAQKPARGMLLMPEEDDDEPQKSSQEDISFPIFESHDEEEDDNETMIVQKPKAASDASQPEKTGSLQWGGFFSRKHYQLKIGANVIGRKDKKTPSDLEFDDQEMSRRSVNIEVAPDGQGGCSFTLSVLKALNPVKVNDRQIAQGINVPLNHNDTIVMGQTTLTLKVDK